MYTTRPGTGLSHQWPGAATDSLDKAKNPDCVPVGSMLQSPTFEANSSCGPCLISLYTSKPPWQWDLDVYRPLCFKISANSAVNVVPSAKNVKSLVIRSHETMCRHLRRRNSKNTARPWRGKSCTRLLKKPLLSFSSLEYPSGNSFCSSKTTSRYSSVVWLSVLIPDSTIEKYLNNSAGKTYCKALESTLDIFLLKVPQTILLP
jgi:hypothetical protein